MFLPIPGSELIPVDKLVWSAFREFFVITTSTSLIIFFNCLFSGVRAFANSFADYELTQKTDTYIHYHMTDILRGPEITNLPYLQVDIVGKNIISFLWITTPAPVSIPLGYGMESKVGGNILP